MLDEHDDHRDAHRRRSRRRRPRLATPLRFVTVASLFDGHDAAINVMRRLIQDSGAEVVHLGHNRSVSDVVRAAIQEDVDGIAISSYQGGHVEYFKYAVDMLRERGAEHIRVFGGGGGTITPAEIAELQAYGVERIYHPNDGMALGLTGMIDDLVDSDGRGTRAVTSRSPRRSPAPRARRPDDRPDAVGARGRRARRRGARAAAASSGKPPALDVPVVGITGHRRRRQEHGHRRAAEPVHAAASGAAGRGAGGRPDPAAHRRRAARRPDPDEQPAQRADLHALDGDPASERVDQRDARRMRSRSCARPGSTW